MLGQERCDVKENEIRAIPRLLERLELRGALVTIDGEAVRGRPSGGRPSVAGSCFRVRFRMG